MRQTRMQRYALNSAKCCRLGSRYLGLQMLFLHAATRAPSAVALRRAMPHTTVAMSLSNLRMDIMQQPACRLRQRDQSSQSALHVTSNVTRAFSVYEIYETAHWMAASSLHRATSAPAALATSVYEIYETAPWMATASSLHRAALAPAALAPSVFETAIWMATTATIGHHWPP